MQKSRKRSRTEQNRYCNERTEQIEKVDTAMNYYEKGSVIGLMLCLEKGSVIGLMLCLEWDDSKDEREKVQLKWGSPKGQTKVGNRSRRSVKLR